MSTGLLAACTENDTARIDIRFDAPQMADVALGDLRFYVHDIELIDDQGRVETWRPMPSAWQHERVALVDLAGNSTLQSNRMLSGYLPDRNFVALRFSLGVPFELNHANPLTAPTPLNRGDLFWTWQSGYKFLRLDWVARNKQWSFHLGSTGCSSASSLRPPSAACAQPNVVRVELKPFDPRKQHVRVRFENLIRPLQAADRQSCTGDYAQSPACIAALSVIGLNVQTGRCDGACAQRLFEATNE